MPTITDPGRPAVGFAKPYWPPMTGRTKVGFALVGCVIVIALGTIDEPGVGADESTTTEPFPTLISPNLFLLPDMPGAPTAKRPLKVPAAVEVGRVLVVRL